jgi:RNA polymerase sigma factor (sigma-70 family)
VYEAAALNKPTHPRAFLFQTARNLMIDIIRRGNVVSIEVIADLEQLNALDSAPNPERAVAARQQVRILQAALEELPEEMRKVFLLRKVEGLPQREVAARLGLSEANVETQLARGLRLLMASLTDRRGSLLAAAHRFAQGQLVLKR